MYQRLLLSSLAVALLLAAACGGDGDAKPPPESSVTAAAAPTGAAATQGAPTPDRTEEAFAAKLGVLGTLVLKQGDVPTTYTIRNNQPVSRREAAVSNVAIGKLATFLNTSDLQGAWVAFFVQRQPEISLSSRIYAFGQPASAVNFVRTIGGLETADYPAATGVERVQADTVGEASQMMRYRLPGSLSLEYTWAQGRLAGQIVLRYAGETENPDDVGLIVSLARKQAEKMQAGLPE